MAERKDGIQIEPGCRPARTDKAGAIARCGARTDGQAGNRTRLPTVPIRMIRPHDFHPRKAMVGLLVRQPIDC